MKKEIFMMVGPSAIPDRVLKAMNKSVISHRSEEYSKIQERVTNYLKIIFGTKNDILPLTSSGTGGMEAALVNCFSLGEKIVVPIIGKFSEQFAYMAERFGLTVKRVYFEHGQTADVKTVMEFVEEDTAGILIVHNESSTGVFNDLQSFGKELKNRETLLITDSVSGLGGLEIKMDEWNIDVVITSSQKCLMSPPGLSFIALSDKAWKKVVSSNIPKYYFDLKRAREFENKSHQTPTTTAIYNMFAVAEALEMIKEEGVENLYNRYKSNSRRIIEEVKNLGLEILAENEQYASPSLTAIKVPGKAKEIVKKLSERGIIINSGLEPLEDDIFRVGTMGYVSENDVIAFLYHLKEIINT